MYPWDGTRAEKSKSWHILKILIKTSSLLPSGEVNSRRLSPLYRLNSASAVQPWERIKAWTAPGSATTTQSASLHVRLKGGLFDEGHVNCTANPPRSLRLSPAASPASIRALAPAISASFLFTAVPVGSFDGNLAINLVHVYAMAAPPGPHANIQQGCAGIQHGGKDQGCDIAVTDAIQLQRIDEPLVKEEQ